MEERDVNSPSAGVDSERTNHATKTVKTGADDLIVSVNDTDTYLRANSPSTIVINLVRDKILLYTDIHKGWIFLD